MRQPEAERDVPSDHSAALKRLGDDDVVEVRQRNAGSVDRVADDDLGELEGVDVDERALVGAADRCADSSDDHGFGHAETVTRT